ncbi:MAG TPA: helix-turn-helix domain-containing protein [Stellaceae bacterium]
MLPPPVCTPTARPRPWLVQDIIVVAAGLCGTTPEMTLGETRAHKGVDARHVAMAAVSRLTGWSSSRIGWRFGRDHSSCIHPCAAPG